MLTVAPLKIQQPSANTLKNVKERYGKIGRRGLLVKLLEEVIDMANGKWKYLKGKYLDLLKIFSKKGEVKSGNE
jgi:hypothetical protein